MQVDPADYTKGIRRALKQGGYACVYVASVTGGRPCRVGYSTDLPGCISRLQRSSPVPITVDDVTWFPDRAMATNVAQSVHASIGQYRQPGGWFDLNAFSAVPEIELAAHRLYPSATPVPHAQLISSWSPARKKSGQIGK